MQLSMFEFLTAIKQNNNREWFSDNKETYEKAKEQAATFLNGSPSCSRLFLKYSPNKFILSMLF